MSGFKVAKSAGSFKEAKQYKQSQQAKFGILTA